MSTQPNTSLREFVISALAAAANVDRRTISEDTSVLDLGIDSVSLAGVVAQIEMQYSCEVPLDQVYELFDAPLVRDVVMIVSRFAPVVPESSGANTDTRSLSPRDVS